LIDEIASATDPEQGAALAQAILERLVEKQVLAVITTHYTSLKVFAENSASCVNASMQFDPVKHEPTYQFVLGFPGNSFALEIAQNLGMAKNLIDRAKELTGSQNIILTDLIKKMNAEKQKLAENNYQLELKTRLFELKSKELETKLHDLEKEKKKLLKSSLTDTQEYLTGIQRLINEELSDLKKLSREDKKTQLTKLNNDVVNFQQEIHEKKQKISLRPATNQDLNIGDAVWLLSFETKAKIVDCQKDLYKVDMNGIFYNVKKKDLQKLQDDKPEEPVTIVSRKNTDYNNKAKLEINLLGKTFDEALPLIQELIDNALFCGLSKVRIVHGRGTGILRQKIRNYLKNNNKVQEFYSPPQEAGGDGVTVVALHL
jgi:DNA mismatch repair protein MutS2